jgi:hypothetical protein
MQLGTSGAAYPLYDTHGVPSRGETDQGNGQHGENSVTGKCRGTFALGNFFRAHPIL